MSYKLSDEGEERALYYGPSYEWDFQLPHSSKPGKLFVLCVFFLTGTSLDQLIFRGSRPHGGSLS